MYVPCTSGDGTWTGYPFLDGHPQPSRAARVGAKYYTPDLTNISNRKEHATENPR